jgi:Glycosyl transferase family 2
VITNWLNQSTKLITWLDEERIMGVMGTLDSFATWEAGTSDLLKVITANSSLIRYTPDAISEAGSGAYYCVKTIDVPDNFTARFPVFLRDCLKSALFSVKKLDSSETNPRVTVIISTYNREEECARAVDSVLKQTYENVRCLVVKDGPGEYTGLPEDPRLEIHVLPRRTRYPVNEEKKWHVAGVGPFNYANALTEGPIMCLLDDDDVYLTDHVETIVNEWRQSRAHIIYTEPYTSDDRKPFEFDFDRQRLEKENFIFSCATAYCGAALAVAYTPPYADYPGDWMALRRMSECGLIFKKISKVTTVHGDESLTRKRKAYIQMLRMQQDKDNG